MSAITINTTTRDLLRDVAVLSVGAVTGICLYNLLRKRRRETETPTPLIDSISCYKEGVLSSIITFGWDEDEMFSWARETYLDADGHTTCEHLIEAEEYNSKLLIVESDCLEEAGTPEITTIDLDPFGMGTSLSFRRTSGKEEHWDLQLNGGQLQSIGRRSGDLIVDWDTSGNITSITSRDGEYSQRMTYYSNVPNGVFPDLNYLSHDLSVYNLSSYILGSRSSNLISSMVIRKPDYHYHLLASYLCDRFDQPLQVRHETTEIIGGEVKESTLRYDIKYL